MFCAPNETSRAIRRASRETGRSRGSFEDMNEYGATCSVLRSFGSGPRGGFRLFGRFHARRAARRSERRGRRAAFDAFGRARGGSGRERTVRCGVGRGCVGRAQADTDAARVPRHDVHLRERVPGDLQPLQSRLPERREPAVLLGDLQRHPRLVPGALPEQLRRVREREPKRDGKQGLRRARLRALTSRMLAEVMPSKRG